MKQCFESAWFYEYGFRDYDAQLGRWHSIDPMAEMAMYESPYVYGGNNPINNIDVAGLWKVRKDPGPEIGGASGWGWGASGGGRHRGWGGGGTGGGGGGGGGGGSSLDNAREQADAYDADVYDYYSNFTYVPGVGSVNRNDVVQFEWKDISGRYNNTEGGFTYNEEDGTYHLNDAADKVMAWVPVENKGEIRNILDGYDGPKYHMGYPPMVGGVGKLAQSLEGVTSLLFAATILHSASKVHGNSNSNTNSQIVYSIWGTNIYNGKIVVLKYGVAGQNYDTFGGYGNSRPTSQLTDQLRAKYPELMITYDIIARLPSRFLAYGLEYTLVAHHMATHMGRMPLEQLRPTPKF